MVESAKSRYWLPIAVAVAVAAGVVMRLVVFSQSLYGDELSTLYIVNGHGLGGTVDFIAGDGEISPPLYFVLAWFAGKLGSAPELIRLPSMLAGLASLPLYYLLGRRLFGGRAGQVAVVVAAISPILVYFSANGRAYSVMIFFLLVSTLAMLIAAEAGRARWWAVYAVAVAAAMYSHYTAAFVLAFQFLWVLWCFPAARLRAAAATAVSAVLFLPWLPSYFADADSPTTPILELLQGSGFDAKRTAVEQLLFWEVGVEKWSLDGRWDAALIVTGVLIALVFLIVRAVGSTGLREWLKAADRNLALVAGLCLCSPAGALVLGIFSTDVFGGRNLGASWTGIPLLIGALIAAAGPVWGTISLLVVSAGLLAGSIHLADGSRSEFPYRDAAAFVDARATSGDAVVDTSHVTPVPLTPLDTYLDYDGPEYRPGLPDGPPPFLPSTPVPDAADELEQAFSGSDRVFLVDFDGEQPATGDGALTFRGERFELPPGVSIAEQETFDGIKPITVTVLEHDADEPRTTKEPQ